MRQGFGTYLAIIGASLMAAPAATAGASDGTLDFAAQAKLSADAHKLYSVQAKSCRWGSATIDTAMFNEQYMWGQLARVLDPAFKPNSKTESIDEMPCDSPANQRAQSNAALIYWRWLTRTAIFANLVSEAGWGKDLLDLDFGPIKMMEPIRANLEKNMVASAGQAVVQTEIANLQRESVLVLNLLCEERKNSPAGTQRACPAIPENLAGQRPMAKVRAEAVEVFNLGMHDAIAREQRGEYGTPYQFRETLDFFGNINTDYMNSTGCDPEIYTIYPAANDTVIAGEILDVSVHKIGTAGTFGRIKVKRDDYGNYDIFDGSALNIYSAALGPEFGVCFG